MSEELTDRQKVQAIWRLQAVANQQVADALAQLETADAMASELHAKYGKHFVCDGVSYSFVYRCKFDIAGNRDWLVRDDFVKVIQ